MNLFDKLKALSLLNKAEKQMEEGMETKNATKVVAAFIALVTGLMQIPAIQNAVIAQVAAHPAIALALTGISGILALIHNPKTVAAIVLALVLFGSAWTVQAQVVSASSDAVAVRYQGEWSAGTVVTQSFDLLDLGAKKTNRIYLQGVQALLPTPGLSLYMGGIKFEPDLTSLLAKTNVPAGNFGVSLNVAAGNGIPSDAGGSHVSFIAGGGVRYKMLDSLAWNALQAQVFQFGNQRGAMLSTGLAYAFGK